MEKLKLLIKNPRIIALIIVLVLAIVAINPQLESDGVAIRQVTRGSAAELAGLQSPAAGAMPTSREVITNVNGQPVTNIDDFYKLTAGLPDNTTVTVQTDRGIYRLVTQPLTSVEVVTEGNETFNRTTVLGTADLGLSVYDAPANNIGKGLDLSGGTRVILQPERPVSTEDRDFIIDNIGQRLNAFGLSDIVVRQATDLSGSSFIVVEVPGVNKEEVRELLSSQGLFEARIDNATIFTGGEDIASVCTTPDCSGIDMRGGGCQSVTGGGWMCRFQFAITLSDRAAHAQAAATERLTIQTGDGGGYLSSPLDLYLDGELVDTLQISADLKGRPVTDIQITGSGVGSDNAAASKDAVSNMKRLQTILKTGSLPVKLDIVKMDSISPVLGKEFIRNAVLMGLAAIIAVALVIFIRYRKLSISIPVVITMLSEAIMILGVSSFIRWNLDLAAIAGVIIAIGTGVDDQIVIIDETLKGDTSDFGRSWRERLKRAFFIIFAAFVTTIVAMLPLIWAGVGLLKGFAITTIIGVTIGVLIARPAFAAMVEILLKNDE